MRLALLFIAALTVVSCSQPAEEKPTSSPMNGIAMSSKEFADAAGVPVYPGAKTPDGRSSLKEDGGEKRYEFILLTPDAPEKVMAFYEKAFKTKGQRVGNHWMGMTDSGGFAQVGAEKKANETEISIVVRKSEP